MIPTLPLYISQFFLATTLVCLLLFARTVSYSPKALIAPIAIFIIQAMLSLSGFYLISNTTPPRFIWMIAPSLLILLLVLFSRAGKTFMASCSLKQLTWIHIIRIPVEMVLWWLASHKMVPQLMTFEGFNFDILSGITAPIVILFAFKGNQIKKQLLIGWNIICLLLVLWIVAIAILSSPVPFQQFAFDQPNIAVQYFPFVWLPSCIVPIVLFAHLCSLYQLLSPTKTSAMNK